MANEEFHALTALERHEYIKNNFPSNLISKAKRSPLCGVGINDADYISQPKSNGRLLRCPAYQAWARILTRAYSAKVHNKHPSYRNVTVCKEWHIFSGFLPWWLEHQIDGYEIDKDILGTSREYGPDTCIFVPDWLNTLTVSAIDYSRRGELPVGVYFCKNNAKFRAHCRDSTLPSSRLIQLGCFDSPMDAHLAWKAKKLEIIENLKPDMDEIDLRIYQCVINIINRASELVGNRNK